MCRLILTYIRSLIHALSYFLFLSGLIEKFIQTVSYVLTWLIRCIDKQCRDEHSETSDRLHKFRVFHSYWYQFGIRLSYMPTCISTFKGIGNGKCCVHLIYFGFCLTQVNVCSRSNQRWFTWSMLYCSLLNKCCDVEEFMEF